MRWACTAKTMIGQRNVLSSSKSLGVRDGGCDIGPADGYIRKCRGLIPAQGDASQLLYLDVIYLIRSHKK